MLIIYNIVIRIYALLVGLASMFNVRKARQFKNGRKKWQDLLKNKVEKGANYIWVHCASLGEFEQGRPLIEKIKAEKPRYKILLTFFSPSGYEIRKNYDKADIVTYLPLDTKNNATLFLDIVQPQMAIFVKYEFWYHYLTQLKKRKIAAYSISTIFRPQQSFFRKTFWGKWYRKMLQNFTHFFLQNQQSAQLLSSINVNNYSVVGDTRFDRVFAIAQKAVELPLIKTFAANNPTLIAGSTWQPDEELLVQYINRHSEFAYIIAPHEINREHIKKLQKSICLPSICYSKAVTSNIANKKVLIIDSIGLLSSIYQYGAIAYIGGGFGVGIHNILEAATFGLPVVFGANYHKFKEAIELIEQEGAFSINNFEQLVDVLDRLFKNEEFKSRAAKTAKNYVHENVGATEQIFLFLFEK